LHQRVARGSAVVAWFIVLCVLVGGTVLGPVGPTRAARGAGALDGPVNVTGLLAPPPPPNSLPIRHIVVIMQENHAYDNFFGTYCQLSGPYCPTTGNGFPNGTCVPYNTSNLSRGCFRPWPVHNDTASQTQDIGHDWNQSHEAYDHGRMDGWFRAEGNSTRPLGYYNGSTIPTYWDWAEQYALGDDFFSSDMSYSLPNHWSLVAGAAPNASYYYDMYGPGKLVQRGNYTHTGLYSFQKVYLDEANATPTVFDQLLAANENGSPVTW